MAASLKLRDGQKPLVRAKIPINILGLPMVSGITAGDSKELCLHLGTFWDSGPALKVNYKPNESWNPFSLVLKTGIGEWGSPAGAALAMTAEINILGRGNPSFSLQFKPNFGDFTLKKLVKSTLVVPSKPSEDGGLLGPKPYFSPDGLKAGSADCREVTPASSRFQLKINGFDHEGAPGKGKEDDAEAENGTMTPNSLVNNSGFALNLAEEKTQTHHFSEGVGHLGDFRHVGPEKMIEGMSLTARSSFPVRKHAMVSFRWGVKLSFDAFKGWERGDGFSASKLPCLFLEKVSIENVEQMRKGRKGGPFGDSQLPLESLMLPIVREEANELAHITSICCSMRRQLHLLQTENSVMRKAMEGMRSQLESNGIRNSTDSFPSVDIGSLHKDLEDSGMKDKTRETNGIENDKKKGGSRENAKKESKAPNGGLGNGYPSSVGSSAMDVSEELKKAIRGASGGLGDK